MPDSDNKRVIDDVVGVTEHNDPGTYHANQKRLRISEYDKICMLRRVSHRLHEQINIGEWTEMKKEVTLLVEIYREYNSKANAESLKEGDGTDKKLDTSYFNLQPIHDKLNQCVMESFILAWVLYGDEIVAQATRDSGGKACVNELLEFYNGLKGTFQRIKFVKTFGFNELVKRYDARDKLSPHAQMLADFFIGSETMENVEKRDAYLQKFTENRDSMQPRWCIFICEVLGVPAVLWVNPRSRPRPNVGKEHLGMPMEFTRELTTLPGTYSDPNTSRWGSKIYIQLLMNTERVGKFHMSLLIPHNEENDRRLVSNEDTWDITVRFFGVFGSKEPPSVGEKYATCGRCGRGIFYE